MNQTSYNLSLFKVNESVEVLVENVNDNPPNFAQHHYMLEVNEVSSAGVSYLFLIIVCLTLDMLTNFYVSFSSLQSIPALD